MRADEVGKREVGCHVQEFEICLWLMGRQRGLQVRREGGWFELYKNPPGPGAATHACNPSTLGSQDRSEYHLSPGVQDQPGQHSETLSQQKIQKLARVVVCACGSRYLGG